MSVETRTLSDSSVLDGSILFALLSSAVSSGEVVNANMVPRYPIQLKATTIPANIDMYEMNIDHRARPMPRCG
jgi:hypothetical protein